MGAVALRLTGGHKSYHRGPVQVEVLRDVDLEVLDGEVLALLGPSGCGKSTLLRIIAGLEPLGAGSIAVNAGTARDRERVGIAFQQPNLFPWLTVAENVSLGLWFAANSGARDGQPVDALLDEFGLTPVADAYPSELSGGQAQRVSLARTVVTRPRVLLLDEPFAALDPRTRAALTDWLLEIQRSHRLTIVMVTHDVAEALAVGDRVALMSGAPGSIAHVWDVPPAVRRDRESAAAHGLRLEILGQYAGDAARGAA
jgi:ABC-type nitrate/sulfonate/bicarbonate transport system ATPase subunit